MIIVTGGSGFIGSAFVAKLNLEGQRDILVVDEFDESSKWKNIAGKHIYDAVGKDEFLSLLLEGQLPEKIDAIVHLGACSSTTERDVGYLLQNNVRYSQALATFAVDRNIRFIYASSAATYGNGELGYGDDLESLPNLKPMNPYGFSKQIFDLWALNSGLLDRMAGIKFFNVYGPNEYHKGDQSSVVFKSVNEINTSGSISLFKSCRPDFKDGEQKRDFIYVKDCCEVLWWLLKTPTVSGIFNLGSGSARTWNDLANGVFKALGREAVIKYIDLPESLRTHYQYFTQAPMEKLLQAGYKKGFHTLEQGIDDYVGNYLKSGITYY